MLRTGVVVALATGALVGMSAPAFAADPQLAATPDNVTIRAGSDVTVSANITNTDPTAITLALSFTGLPQGVSCSAGCADVQVPASGSKTQLLTLKAAADAPAANGTKATLRAQGAGPAGNATDEVTITVQPVQQAPQHVLEVSGQVYDLTSGQGIAAATVAMQDGAGGQFNATADSQGRFKFTSTAAKPIIPGTILVGAVKSPGFAQGQKEVEGRAGTVVANVRIGLKAIVESASAAALPSAEVVLPSADASVEAVNTEQASTGDSGSGGMFSMLLIGMGGLLVALGIGAIVLLLLRRRGDDEEDDEEGAAPVPPGPRSPAPRPAATGMYRSGGPDPTMIPRAAAIGDRTMITRAAPNDAATTMHRPLPVEEYGDPYRGGNAYGSPAGYASPQPPGYGGAAYGSPAGAAQPGYGYPTPPARPPADPYPGGYGVSGSPAAPGYGTPSGGQHSGYEPEDPGRYGGGYESGGYSANGYDQGGYDHGGYSQPPSGGGHGDGGYAANGYDQGGYGQPPTGYESRGYDGGYDQRAPDQRSGYEARGYDGYYDEGARQPGRAERRSLDWLDD